jgi:F0F1-type ATP synthase membrane subunit b/b'
MMTNNPPQDKKSNLSISKTNKPPEMEEMSFDINAEIDQLEELILGSSRIPVVNKILVDEDKVISQLDLIRINIPEILEEAMRIVDQKNQIIGDAQSYAQKMVDNAQRKAAQLLDESRIVQQAETQAGEIRRRVQQDCDSLQKKTISDVEQMRHKIQQEAFKTRQQAIVEAEEIQTEADNYADMMLLRLEKQLAEMLRIVNNGRQQINKDHTTHQTKSQEALVNQKVS